ncbi:DUF354 domain-containing protein [Methanolobus sp. ZRKC3]|uniref:DUF354 domain-containing protein n=1 Tax=Methanolobus sp. ZRKC3 TaxID=3125786 RepID=UPI0032464828
MKVQIDIGHPAHVHFYKNFVQIMEERGHEIKVTAQKKDITLELLDLIGVDYVYAGQKYNGMLKKAIGTIYRDYLFYKLAKQFKPDIITGVLDMYGAHVAKVVGSKCVTFTDTEGANLIRHLTMPFISEIYTPSCFNINLGKKQVKYTGYKELAYLHPKYFKPDKTVLEELGIKSNEKFIIIRLVSWQASHDINDKGFENLADALSILEKYGRILITSELKFEGELEKFKDYEVKISPEKMHSLLSYATMYIGESATMATECAVLGTPSILISTSRRGYTDELEEKYGLIYNFSDPLKGQSQALNKAIELLSGDNIKNEWTRRRDTMLSEKIDVTSFMVDLIEGYPNSVKEVLDKYDCSYSSA